MAQVKDSKSAPGTAPESKSTLPQFSLPVNSADLTPGPSRNSSLGMSSQRLNLFECSLFQVKKNAQNAQPFNLRCGNMNCKVRCVHPGRCCGVRCVHRERSRGTREEPLAPALFTLSEVEGSLPKGAQSKGGRVLVSSEVHGHVSASANAMFTRINHTSTPASSALDRAGPSEMQTHRKCPPRRTKPLECVPAIGGRHRRAPATPLESALTRLLASKSFRFCT